MSKRQLEKYSIDDQEKTKISLEYSDEPITIRSPLSHYDFELAMVQYEYGVMQN